MATSMPQALRSSRATTSPGFSETIVQWLRTMPRRIPGRVCSPPGTQVSTRYVSSHGLGYDSSGTPRIDAGYNKRVRHLMSVIAEEVALQDIPGS
jgi:hypothetical protein